MKCVAHFAENRAIGGLVAPPAIIALMMIISLSNGHSPISIFWSTLDGTTPIRGPLALTIGIIYWAIFAIVPACRASAGGCAISIKKDQIISIFGCGDFHASDISIVIAKGWDIRRKLIFTFKNGNTLAFPIFYIKEKENIIVHEINSILAKHVFA